MDSCSGFTSLIPLSELSDSSKGYLVNDTCIVEAKVVVHKAEIKIFKEQTSSSAAPIRASPPQNRRQGRKASFRPTDCRPSKSAQVVSTSKLKAKARAMVRAGAKRMRRRGGEEGGENEEAVEDQEAEEAQIVTLKSARRRPRPCLVPPIAPFARPKTRRWKQGKKVSVDFGSDFTNQTSDLFRGGDALGPSDKECKTSGPSNVQAQSKCTAAQICAKPNEIPDGPPIVKEHEDASSTPDEELMDFRGLGKIQKTFVPLLDEVCSWHPSLIECQRKRSLMFSEWAFTALGRLLHFLKTGKVKDMTHDTIVQHLLLLWEELEAFGFDLAWLKPCVQRALGTKEMAERAGQLRRMREDVDALQSQTKMLRDALDVAEANLEAAIRNLYKNHQDFHEVDMDAGLWDGYIDFSSVACS